MKYTKFTIKKYRAISQDVVLKIDDHGVLPIIGINECGKTTILQAIFAFDYQNDHESERYGQLKEVTNLLNIRNNKAIIAANIESENKIINECFTSTKDSNPHKPTEEESKIFYESFPCDKPSKCYLTITRTINGQSFYALDLYTDETRKNPITFQSHEFTDGFAKSIISKCPAIIYYDDFRDRFDEEIDITDNSTPKEGFSVSTLENIFKEAYKNKKEDEKITFQEMCKLPDEGKIRTALSPVVNLINAKLTDKWSMLHKVDEGKPLTKSIEIVLDPLNKNDGKRYIKVRVKEKVKNDQGELEDKFYDINQRSKGFYWFFNFTLKTTFNPKTLTNRSTIYLLDEPGCYLHASAQKGLCKILDEDLGVNQVVIYNTHSHYLLDKKFIPKARIASKENGSISLVHFSQYNNSSKYDALQPLKDALRLEPSVFEEQITKSKIVILEGISDFCCFDTFCASDELGFLMATGSGAIIDYCAILFSLKKDFVCLLDGDKEGKETIEKIRSDFGDHVKAFDYGDSITLEKIFDTEELKEVLKQEGQNPYTKNKNKLEGFIYHLYTSKNKEDLIKKLPKSKANFEQLIKKIIGA